MKTEVRVLVVEDEILLRRNLVKKIELLRPQNIVVAGDAMNGQIALDMLKKTYPDIILTDIQMPVMSGLELISKARQLYPHIEYVLLSSYSEFSYAQKAIELRVSSYLLKPVQMAELKKVLVDIINRKYLACDMPLSDKELNHKEIVSQFVEYIKNNYKTTISLSELSKKFGYTMEYLGKIFKEEMNMTPCGYITHLRIENAKSILLNNPELDIYKVAKMVGYGENCYYFSRVFKQKTGMNPSEFGKIGSHL